MYCEGVVLFFVLCCNSVIFCEYCVELVRVFC